MRKYLLIMEIKLTHVFIYLSLKKKRRSNPLLLTLSFISIEVILWNLYKCLVKRLSINMSEKSVYIKGQEFLKLLIRKDCLVIKKLHYDTVNLHLLSSLLTTQFLQLKDNSLMSKQLKNGILHETVPQLENIF